MTHKHNGGPAFPLPCDDHRDFHAVFESGYGGISIRDYFAAKALEGICASGPGVEWTDLRIAREAYALADAMLAAKEVGNECSG